MQRRMALKTRDRDTGASEKESWNFFAAGMLLTVAAAIGPMERPLEHVVHRSIAWGQWCAHRKPLKQGAMSDERGEDHV